MIKSIDSPLSGCCLLNRGELNEELLVCDNIYFIVTLYMDKALRELLEIKR